MEDYGDIQTEPVLREPRKRMGKVSEAQKQELIDRDTALYKQYERVAKVYNTDDGKLLLASLTSKYMRTLSFDFDKVSDIGYDAAVARGFYIDGQKSLVLQQLKAVEVIEQYPTLSGFLKRNSKTHSHS